MTTLPASHPVFNDPAQAQHLVGKLVIWQPEEEMFDISNNSLWFDKYNPTSKSTTGGAMVEVRIGDVLGMVVEVGQVWDMLPGIHLPSVKGTPDSGRDMNFAYGSVCAMVLSGDGFLLFWAGSLVEAPQKEEVVGS